MKYGITLLGNRVSPRCTCTDSILFVSQTRNEIRSKKRVPVSDLNIPDLCEVLHQNRADTLVCGGITRDGKSFLRSQNFAIIDNVACTAEKIIQAMGIDMKVPGYSVPSLVDWNNDGLQDLIVGQGGGGEQGKIRVYLNFGTAYEPLFFAWFYVQSEGSDLVCPAIGCLGCFPRVVYWDDDWRKDLLVGQADGTIKIFLNNGTDEIPIFDSGTLLKVGAVGFKKNIDVIDKVPKTVRWIIYYLIIFWILFFGNFSTAPEFIYFQF